jgi:phage baseplate assembly protein V
MSDLVATLRAIVRHELAAARLPELGVVTEVFSRDSDSSDGNHQVSVRLQASGVELPRAAVAVGRLGLSALPRVGDLVVVAFIAGDLNAPVVLGSLYDDVSHPPVARPNEIVYQHPDDAESGVRRLHLALPGGALLTADDDKVVLEAGDTVVEVAMDGDVSVKCKANVLIEAQGDVEIQAGGKLVLSAQGEVQVKGATAALEGQSQAKVKAPSLSLAGNTQFSPS